MLLQGNFSTAMPKRRKSTKSKKKDQGGSNGKNELGGEHPKQVAEHKSEPGEAKQKDADGKKGTSGDEDKDWEWSDGELDDERLQAFFDKRPVHMT